MPKIKAQFIVTISAPDGRHVKRFYGLDAAAGNRAIAYASKQLGRAICRDVTDEWLSEVGCLAVSAVCDHGRMIEIYQHLDSTGPWMSPGPAVVVRTVRAADDDADPVRNEWAGVGPDCLPDSDFWLSPAERSS